MRRRLVISYLVLVAVALTAFSVPVGISLAGLLHDDQREVGLREARTVAVLLATAEEADSTTARGALLALETLRSNLEDQTGGRVELITAAGDPALGREVQNPDDDDFAAALAGQERVQRLPVSVLGQPGLQVTVPAVAPGDRIDGAVRLTYPEAPVQERLANVWTFRLVTGAAVLLLAGILAATFAKSLTRPLRLLDAMAARISAGDFTARTDPSLAGPPETRRLAETLNDGARRIGTLVEAQRSFTADASHQLRTPLTALRLNLDNLRDRVERRDEKAAVDKALAEAGRLARLVNSLLALARAQSAIRRPEAIDVGIVVARRLDAWSAAAEESNVELLSSPRAVTGGDHQPVLAWITPGHLEQVLDNLLANALQSSTPGTTLTVTVRASGGQVILDVADQGPGLTAEELERVFDRFWSKTPGGSGLGLPIVRQLVEHDTGNVQLLTKPGAVPQSTKPGQPSGLTVRITLPAWSKPLDKR